VFAEIAAVGGIGLIVRIVYLMRVDEFVPDRELLDKGKRIPSLIFRVTRAFTCDGQRAIRQFAGRDIC
jgi:hypothetical protein